MKCKIKKLSNVKKVTDLMFINVKTFINLFFLLKEAPISCLNNHCELLQYKEAFLIKRVCFG